MLSAEEIKNIAEEYPSHISGKLKKRDENLYQHIKENYKGEKFTERLYRFLYGNEDSVCALKTCESEVRFLSFTRGFRKFCSRNCSSDSVKSEDSKEVIECAYCKEKLEAYKSDNKKYCSRDCYVAHRNEKEDFDEQLKKAREACQDEHGSMGFGSEKIRDKIHNTMEEKYGDKFYVNEEKRKRTKRKKYGDPNYINKEKKKQTCREKYDDPHYNNRKQAVATRKNSKYEELLNNPKFSNVLPQFSKEKYNGAKKYVKYSFKCNKCGKDFEDYLYSGNVPRCPNCYDGWNHVGSSEKEKGVANFVEEILPDSEEVIKNDRDVLNGKELDVFIPSKQIAIEFDGLYWHSELQGEKDKNYHLKKTKACEERGIHLIHIFENEWTQKQDIVKSRLRHILGASNQNSIYARNCSVKQIENDQKKEFLENYHIQGAGRSKVKLGIFYGEFFDSKLVGVMTFGTPSVAQGHKEDGRREQWEMKRFALSRLVVGGAGKLFKHFIRNFDCTKLKTYADRRWSTKLDNVYEKIGFEHIGSSEPNYYYFRREKGASQELKHRFNFRKNVLDEKLDSFNPDLTEWENMQRNGYDRIWDCGHLKYRWTRT